MQRGGQAGQSSSREEDKREEGEGSGYCSRSTPPLWRVKKITCEGGEG